MKGLLLLLLAFSICFTRASTSNKGQCPQLSLQQNFTLRKYMGTWFEIQRLPTAFVQGKCTAEKYTLLPDGWIKLLTQEVMSNGSVATFEGDIVSASVNETAKLQFKAFKSGANRLRHFKDFPDCFTPVANVNPYFLNDDVESFLYAVSYFFSGSAGDLATGLLSEYTHTTPYMPYWVLSTDYTSYSLVYSCWSSFSFNLRHKEYAWILSRQRHLQENTTNYLRDILISNDVNIKDMVISDQEGCPAYT
ncbi:apolipoprotein D-like [Heptranchias perlo]|uniref:apolipoprotein D-like n=1 Tax=Heptranchias perlo TaxID=212740 RepID=UPI00355A8D03